MFNFDIIIFYTKKHQENKLLKNDIPREEPTL